VYDEVDGRSVGEKDVRHGFRLALDTNGTFASVNLISNPNVSVGTGMRLAADSNDNLWVGVTTYQTSGAITLGRYKPSGAYTSIVVANGGSSCCSPNISDVVFVGGRIFYARAGNTIGIITP
jgi:hypothetical protein